VIVTVFRMLREHLTLALALERWQVSFLHLVILIF
jgi:hypothetical protein